MDGDRFDAIVRTLGRAASRRGSLKLLAGGALGAVAARLGVGEAAAACVAAGKQCGKGDKCCAGSKCKGGTCKCRAGLKDCGKVCKACCTGDDCAIGQACARGRCACTAASCPNGCCEGDVCKDGDATGACGTGGGRCTVCPEPTEGTATCRADGTCGQTCPDARPCRCQDRCVDVRADDFSGNDVDPCKFRVITFYRDNVAVTNGRLEMTSGGPQSGGLAEYECRLAGDYEVEVEFDLLAFPNRSLAFLTAFAPGSNQGLISRERSSDGSDFYRFSASGRIIADVPTTDTSGALRLTRTGTVVEGSYRTGAGAWVAVGAATVAEAEPASVTLNALNNARPIDPTMRVAFDNFKVGAGTAVVCDGDVTCPA